MRYSQDLIEEIRISNDIVQVIGEYIPLKQKGGTYFGLCPFHNEKTPSFSVNAQKQLYYCFGCGAGGNVFSFVMQMENISFVEAVKKLADRVSIKLPEPEKSAEQEELDRLRSRLFEMHKAAGRFYYDCLNSPEGKEAYEYLRKREISDKTIRKFGLGYSPGGGRLVKLLKSKGYTDTEILKSGLAVQDKTKNVLRDRFYKRVMFPIFDAGGRVIGFGGRILDKGEPKYLNSPETVLFNKSHNFYGLNFAKNSKINEIIIVEGYMDVISMHQAGFTNAAAGLGTAFNNDHARTLKKFTKDVILLYDSDEAGERAALRAIPILVSNGFRVKVVQVPEGKDPDEFIKQKGALEFRKLLINAKSYITFKVECALKKYNLKNADHKVAFGEEAAKILAEVESDIERDVYIKEVSDLSGISKDALRSEVGKILRKEDITFEKEAEKRRVRIYSDNKEEGFDIPKGVEDAQKNIIYMCFMRYDIALKLKDILSKDEFFGDVYKKVYEIILGCAASGTKMAPAEVVNYFDTIAEQKCVSNIFSNRTEYKDILHIEKAVNEGVKIIKRAALDNFAARAQSIDDINYLLKERKKLDKLNITLADG